jgi:dTMP kinase
MPRMGKRIPGGLLIVVEGIDGAGKTTLARRLADTMRDDMHLDVVQSKEPTQGRYGTQLRATAATQRLDPDAELALLVADRREHVEQLVAPTLEAGGVVILDRYYFSNLAYQGVAGVDLERIREANAFAPLPQKVLLLDLPAEVGLARIGARGDNPNAFETVANLQAVRRLFHRILPPAPTGAIIDATASADEVHAHALKHVLAAIVDQVRLHAGESAESTEHIRHLINDPA